MKKTIYCKHCREESLEIEEGGLYEVVSCSPLPDQDDVPEDEKKCRVVWKFSSDEPLRSAGSGIALSEKIYMLNALWFKPDGGADKYAEYGVAAAPFVQALGGKMVDGYRPEQSLIGEWDPDLFFLVEWPNWDSFTKLGEDPGYQKIAHLREDALAKSLLIQCGKVS